MKRVAECYPRGVKAATLATVLLTAAALDANAATVELSVKDSKGAPLEDAAAWLTPKSGAAPVLKREAAIAQRDKTFIPSVTIVQTGTPIRFPNQDPFRHHVYSFSPAKTFEIKLYAGTPVAPIVFDRPGEVVLGCNIHDPMIAWVYVVDTPWFAKTAKDGTARIEGVPAGEYELNLAHHDQAARQAASTVRLKADETLPLAATIAVNSPAPRSATQ